MKTPSAAIRGAIRQFQKRYMALNKNQNPTVEQAKWWAVEYYDLDDSVTKGRIMAAIRVLVKKGKIDR